MRIPRCPFAASSASACKKSVNASSAFRADCPVTIVSCNVSALNEQVVLSYVDPSLHVVSETAWKSHFLQGEHPPEQTRRALGQRFYDSVCHVSDTRLLRCHGSAQRLVSSFHVSPRLFKPTWESTVLSNDSHASEALDLVSGWSRPGACAGRRSNDTLPTYISGTTVLPS